MKDQFPQFQPMMFSQAADSNGAEMTVYLDSSPYPEVTGTPDPATVALLKDSYAGVHGELTAITMYIYQNATSANCGSFANAVLQIAICEMIHLDMLADAITTLGGIASFDDGQYYWNAGNIDYASSLREMLEADIAAERTAIDNYQKQISQTGNQSVKALLSRIVKDEALHFKFFSETLRALR
jgi:bacterioferritin